MSRRHTRYDVLRVYGGRLDGPDGESNAFLRTQRVSSALNCRPGTGIKIRPGIESVPRKFAQPLSRDADTHLLFLSPFPSPPSSSTLFCVRDFCVSTPGDFNDLSIGSNINNVAAFTVRSLDRKANAESVAVIYERLLTRTFWTPRPQPSPFFPPFSPLSFHFPPYVVSARALKRRVFFADGNNEFRRAKLSLDSRRNFLEKVNPWRWFMLALYARNTFDTVSMNLRVIHHNGRCVTPRLCVISRSISISDKTRAIQAF